MFIPQGPQGSEDSRKVCIWIDFLIAVLLLDCNLSLYPPVFEIVRWEILRKIIF